MLLIYLFSYMISILTWDCDQMGTKHLRLRIVKWRGRRAPPEDRQFLQGLGGLPETQRLPPPIPIPIPIPMPPPWMWPPSSLACSHVAVLFSSRGIATFFVCFFLIGNYLLFLFVCFFKIGQINQNLLLFLYPKSIRHLCPIF